MEEARKCVYVCPLDGQEREFRMRTGTTVKYISKSMDMYCKSEKKEKEKRREGKLTNELQNIWNEIHIVVCKREGKKVCGDAKNARRCRPVSLCAFCFPVDLLECCQERFSHLSRLAPKAHALRRETGTWETLI